MPKRSEKRDTAKAEYVARRGRGEEVNLRELAEQMGGSMTAECGEIDRGMPMQCMWLTIKTVFQSRELYNFKKV